MTTEVNPDNQDEHNAEVRKLRDQIAQAKEDMAAEETRMAEERAALDAQAQRVHAESYRLMLDQNSSNKVMRRRHQSRLPPVYEARNLFSTPGAGSSNPATVYRVEAPRTGAPDQARMMDLPQQNHDPPQYVPTPLGHFPTPLDNMIFAATRLAAIPMEGDSPTAIDT